MSEGSEFYPHTHEPLLIVLSGPSGAGKDSVLQRLKERDAQFYFVVTATTRPARPEEKHGKDYFFVSQAEFAELIEKDELIEYAMVYNDYKGVPKAQVREALRSGKDVVMRVDVQGAETIRKLYPEALLIFLTVENEAEMAVRMRKRSTDNEDSIKLRILTARTELKRVHDFDYIVVNREDRLDETVDVILAIIRAEHHRVEPRKVNL
jgi:guanylate kinase